MKAIVSLIAAVLAGISCGQSVFGNATKAFALMPSEVISSGVVSQVSISNSGRLILFQRQIITEVEEKPQNTKSWYVFDRTTKSTKRLTIPSTSMVTTMFDDVHLVHNSNSPDGKAGILNFKTGENLPIELKSGYLMYGGNLPFAPFLMINDGVDNITFLTAEGKSTVATFAKNLSISGPVGGDNQNIYFHSIIKRFTPRTALRLTFNRATGEVSQTPYKNNDEWNDLHPEFQLEGFSVNATGEYSTISFRDPKQSGFSELPWQIRIGLGNGFVQLSSQNDFVLYQDAGSLLLREIKAVDFGLANKLWKAELLAKLVARAKTIGTAVVMWSADHDDKYPGQAGWEDELKPYVRDSNIFGDFTYTYKGGNARDIEDVSGTELGFFVASGGRVVVYADSHVKFVPNP